MCQREGKLHELKTTYYLLHKKYNVLGEGQKQDIQTVGKFISCESTLCWHGNKSWRSFVYFFQRMFLNGAFSISCFATLIFDCCIYCYLLLYLLMITQTALCLFEPVLKVLYQNKLWLFLKMSEGSVTFTDTDSEQGERENWVADRRAASWPPAGAPGPRRRPRCSLGCRRSSKGPPETPWCGPARPRRRCCRGPARSGGRCPRRYLGTGQGRSHRSGRVIKVTHQSKHAVDLRCTGPANL